LFDFFDDFIFGLSVKTFSGKSALKLLDSFCKLIWVVVDRMRLLPELVALSAEIFYLALDFFNGVVDGITLFRKGLKLIELFT
jgi:hypothetical protein